MPLRPPQILKVLPKSYNNPFVQTHHMIHGVYIYIYRATSSLYLVRTPPPPMHMTYTPDRCGSRAHPHHPPGLVLIHRKEMPANNLLLPWQRPTTTTASPASPAST